MNQPPKKYSYYISFDTQIFLSAKELLKSMPTFYNRVYFSIKYARFGALSTFVLASVIYSKLKSHILMISPVSFTDVLKKYFLSQDNRVS